MALDIYDPAWRPAGEDDGVGAAGLVYGAEAFKTGDRLKTLFKGGLCRICEMLYRKNYQGILCRLPGVRRL